MSSGVLIFRSANGGASWDFPGRVAVSSYESSAAFPNGVVLHDKPLFTIDNRVGSPFQDRIYLSWTLFSTDNSAYIYEVHRPTAERPGVRPWSSAPPARPARTRSAFPPLTASPTKISLAISFVGSDGSLYVAYDNYNNQPLSGTGNQYQVLLAKSTDGGADVLPVPVKVSDFYDLPDCATYTGQDAGRSCVVDKSSIQNSFSAPPTTRPERLIRPTRAM